jgi:aspartyl-tRNA synthetase
MLANVLEERGGQMHLICARLCVGIKVRANTANMLWITDFPLFDADVDSKFGELVYTSAHHPFTAPIQDHAHLLTEEVSARLLRRVIYVVSTALPGRQSSVNIMISC